MNNFYTFIVSGTMHTPHGNFTDTERFEQTKETVSSIRKQVPNSKIVFIDNSIIPLSPEEIDYFKNNTDLFINYELNLFSVFVNQRPEHRSFGELLMMDKAIKEIKKNNLIGKRVFKVSARYRLTDKFNIHEYETPDYIGKYAAKISIWQFHTSEGVKNQTFFETRLWSMCKTQVEEFSNKLQDIFNFALLNNQNIEISYLAHFDHLKIINLPVIHLEGLMSDKSYITE